MSSHPRVAIIGGGIGGLTLALELHAAGITCQVFEAVPELTAVGVGINVLPHATRHLAQLGLLDELAAVAVTTKESVFFNRFGQHIYTEPSGTNAGYQWPQFSIHRGDLQAVLAEAGRARRGADAVLTGHRCTAVEQDDTGVTVHLTLARPRRARYLLIWFTQLPPDSAGTFKASVYDVRLKGYLAAGPSRAAAR